LLVFRFNRTINDPYLNSDVCRPDTLCCAHRNYKKTKLRRNLIGLIWIQITNTLLIYKKKTVETLTLNEYK